MKLSISDIIVTQKGSNGDENLYLTCFKHSDNDIEGLNIGINGEYIDKVCGYADDIVFIIKDCSGSIKKLFKTYHIFSKISGIDRALRFYPLVSLLGGGTNTKYCLPVLGD